MFAAWPGARLVSASPEVANRRSVRMLEKAGFAATREIPGDRSGHPELLCTLDRSHIFGPALAAP